MCYNAKLENIIKDLREKGEIGTFSLVGVVEYIEENSNSRDEVIHYFDQLIDVIETHVDNPKWHYHVLLRIIRRDKKGFLIPECLTYVLDTIHPYDLIYAAHTFISGKFPMEFNRILISYLKTEEDVNKSIISFSGKSKSENTCATVVEKNIMDLFENQLNVIKNRHRKKAVC